jgi:hypothetical protein
MEVLWSSIELYGEFLWSPTETLWSSICQFSMEKFLWNFSVWNFIQICKFNDVNLINYSVSRFKMYLNLFLVTGLSWVMDAVQSLLYQRFWYLTDVMSVLQSILIFVVCVWLSRHRNEFLRNSLPAVISDRLSKHASPPPEHPKHPIIRTRLK